MSHPNTDRDERVITFKDWLNREDSGDVEQLERCWNRAATAMRDLCVAKMVALANAAKAKDELTAFHALLDAASDLEALTLDQGEQEK